VTAVVPGPDQNVLRRHFVAVATNSYDEYDDLPVESEVAQLQQWLTDQARLGGRAFGIGAGKLGLNPSEDEIRATFRAPRKSWTERDAAVVFVTGHGDVADNSHWLVLQESERADLPGTAVRTSDLIRWLHRPGGVQHLLLIVDACFAGAVAADTVRFDRELPAGWLILPSASRGGTAAPGALTSAIAAAVGELSGPTGAKHGIHRRYFLVSDFVDTVKACLEKSHPGQDLVPLGYRGVMNAEHVCLPNPHYTEPDTVDTQPQRHELALPKADLDRHWVPRHSGATEGGQWLFTGRADLIRHLIAATTPDPGARSSTVLVTGGAGSGKSAVLARLVTLSDPQFVTAWADRVAGIPPDLRPAVGAVDVAVLATGKYPHEVIDQISTALHTTDLAGGDGSGDLHGRITECRAVLDARAAAGRGTVIVLDAVDEAQDPIGVGTAAAQLTQGNGVTMIIGVRSPTGEVDPPATSGPGGPLADRIEKLTGAQRVRVDADLWWRREDLHRYATNFLTHTSGSPYLDPARHGLAERLAERITGRVGRSFLIARLAANALTQRDDVVDPDDQAWLATLDEDVVTAFRADLNRVYPDRDERLAAVELLRAVAFAYGSGLPWGDIWPAVANAVADRAYKFGDSDIAALLASPMSAYLATGVADDVTVYSLFHAALRDTLRERWHDLLQTAGSGQ
jgi:hypothetical protein